MSEPTRPSTEVITWCQPQDDQARDIIIVGRLETDPEADADLRRQTVAFLNTIASRGRRLDLPGRGWKASSSSGMAARVPVRSPDPSVLPSVTVFVPAPVKDNLSRAVSQVVRTATAAGYLADERDVRDALSYGAAGPKGPLVRVWEWFVGLLDSFTRLFQRKG